MIVTRKPLVCSLLLLTTLWFVGLFADGPDPPENVPPTVLRSDHAYSHQELMERLANIRGEELQAESQEALLSLFFDGQHIGDVLARVSYDGRLPQLRYRDIKRLLGDRLDDETIIALGDQQDLYGWVSTVYLKSYTPSYDSEALRLFFITPPDKRNTGAIDLQKRYKPDFSKAERSEGCSAYINLYNTFRYTDESTSYALDTYNVLRRNHWVYSTHVDYQSNRSAPFSYRRLKATRDYCKRMTRLTIGETQSFNPRLLTNDQIQGIRYGTEYELDPLYVAEPTSEYSFFLEKDATVDVFVNDQFVDTLRLKAGPYDVTNFPLKIGLNRVRLQIRDISGRERTLNFSTIKGPNLLAVGNREFAYSIGVRGRGDDYSGEPVASLFYRKGLTSTRTASIEAQLAPDHLGAGLGIDFATQWLHGSADLGSTITDEGLGMAGRLLLTRSFKHYNITFRADQRSYKFLSPLQTLDATRLKGIQELAINIPRAHKWGSLRLRLANITRWNGDPEREAELSWYYTINERWSIQLTGIHSKYDDPNFDLRGVISYRIAGKKMWRSHDLQWGADQLTLRSAIRGNAAEKHGDWLLQHNHIRPKDGDNTDSLRGTYTYHHNRFLASYNGELGDFGDDNNIDHTVYFNTCMAYAGGQWAFGQPILNSFALVELDPALGDIEVDIYNQDVRSRASQHSPAVIWNLRPYYPAYLQPEAVNNIALITDEPFFLYPCDHSGFLLRVTNPQGEGGSVVLQGTLLDRNGSPVEYTAIRVERLQQGADPVISFTNGSGMFQVAGLFPGESYGIKLGLNDLLAPPNAGYYELTVRGSAEPGIPVDVGSLLPVDTDSVEPAPVIKPAPTMPVPTPGPTPQIERATISGELPAAPAPTYIYHVEDSEKPYRLDVSRIERRREVSDTLHNFMPDTFVAVPFNMPQQVPLAAPQKALPHKRLQASYQLLGAVTPPPNVVAVTKMRHIVEELPAEVRRSLAMVSFEEEIEMPVMQPYKLGHYWERRSILPMVLALFEAYEPEPVAVEIKVLPAPLEPISLHASLQTAYRYDRDAANMLRLTNALRMLDLSRPRKWDMTARWTMQDISDLLLALPGDDQPKKRVCLNPLDDQAAKRLWRQTLALWNVLDAVNVN